MQKPSTDNPWLGIVGSVSGNLAQNKEQMQTFLDTMKTQRRLYGDQDSLRHLDQLSGELKKAGTLEEFVKAIGAPDPQSLVEEAAKSMMADPRKQ
jgi:hypothetical protein